MPLGGLVNVSPDKSSCTGSKVSDSSDKSSLTGSKVSDTPDVVSSQDEQSGLGSYSSFASVKCTLLAKLDLDLILTSSVAWV